MKIGRGIAEINERRLSRMEAHYRQVLGKLDRWTQVRILSDVETRTVLYMGYGAMDYVGLATDRPDLLEELFGRMCAGLQRKPVTAPNEAGDGLRIQ
jgi:hypothetical protein